MGRPFLVVRASIEPAVMDEFLRWYESVHLPNVLRIPGIVRAFRSNCHRRGVNWTALYEMSGEDVIQIAFNSQEAMKARQDWERWMPYVDQLTVEVYAVLNPVQTFHHWN